MEKHEIIIYISIYVIAEFFILIKSHGNESLLIYFMVNLVLLLILLIGVFFIRIFLMAKNINLDSSNFKLRTAENSMVTAPQAFNNLLSQALNDTSTMFIQFKTNLIYLIHQLFEGLRKILFHFLNTLINALNSIVDFMTEVKKQQTDKIAKLVSRVKETGVSDEPNYNGEDSEKLLGVVIDNQKKVLANQKKGAKIRDRRWWITRVLQIGFKFFF